MIQEMSPRTQADRSEATRQALVGAAQELFSERGFRATSTEEIVARAGVTRGALYHHFRDKEDLFRAVYFELQKEKAQRIADAMASDDVVESVKGGLGAYLEACRDPVFQRICHVDAPAVLGADEWRKVTSESSLGMIQAAMTRAIEAGLLPDRPPGVLAHVVHGALMEAGMLVSNDESVDVKEVEQTLIQLLMSFVASGADTQ